MKYPKLPNGPSGPGAAAVRGLQATADSFQTKHGVGYKAQLKDGFSRVELSGEVVYTSMGFGVSDTLKTMGSSDYRQGFAVTQRIAGVSCDRGYAAGARTDPPVDTESTYDYPFTPPPVAGTGWSKPPGGPPWTSPVTYQRRSILERPFQGSGNAQFFNGSLTFERIDYLPDGMALLRPAGMEVLYMGRVLKDGDPDVKTAVFFLRDLGRVDSVGRTLYDPAVSFFFSKGAAEHYAMPMPSGERDYETPRAVVTKDRIYVVIAEKLFAYGPRDLSRDYRPPVWLLRSADGGTTWTRTNIRDPFAEGFAAYKQTVALWSTNPGLPDGPGFFDTAQIDLDSDGHPTISDPLLHSYDAEYIIYPPGWPTPPEVTRGSYAVNPFSADSGIIYDRALALSVQLMQLVACGDDQVLVTYPSEVPVGDNVSLPKGFKVLRISSGGTAVDTVYTYPGDGSPFPPARLVEYLQSVVYLGENTFVAKKVKGNFPEVVPGTHDLQATDYGVAFLRSTDGGATWAESAPVSFPSPAKSHYFGDLFVERAKTTERPGIVLISNYDPDRKGFYLWASEDGGATWTRKGRLAKRDSFVRTDYDIGDVGSGNFKNLTAFDTPAHPRFVDPALPDRYVRKPTP